MKKIMFNDRYGLTRSVLCRDKTQTRRIINPQPECNERIGMVWKGYAHGITTVPQSPYFLEGVYQNFITGTEYDKSCNRFRKREILAIAQPYRDTWFNTDYMTEDEAKKCSGYTNKMFVRADRMPHKIRIINVRVSRLHEISDEDCIKEGITHWTCRGKEYYGFFDYKKDKFVQHSTARDAFADLIDRVFGKGTWDRNPYVFVYDFELI